MNDNAGDIRPCTKWQGEGKDDLPGYKYEPGPQSGFSSWDFPCVTYDPMNASSKKSAMEAALSTGIEELNKMRKELKEEQIKAEFKSTVQREDESDD